MKTDIWAQGAQSDFLIIFFFIKKQKFTVNKPYKNEININTK